MAADVDKPYGDVEYADDGLQADGKARYPLDSQEHCRAAWSYIHMPKNAAKYSPEQLARVKGRIKAALRRYDVQVTEAARLDAEAVAWTDTVTDVVVARGGHPMLVDYRFTESKDFLSLLDGLVDTDPTDPAFSQAVQEAIDSYLDEHPEFRVTEADEPEGEDDPDGKEDPDEDEDEPDGQGDADADADVAETTAVESIQGRVLEAKGNASDGGRVYRVQILRYGVSRNGNSYSKPVMESAARLYEGAKAYDHHRTQQELQSSTLAGLVGSYRGVTAEADGLYGDLHLLPSATHTAEALDATLVNQAAGLPPLVGISHDVMANFGHTTVSGGRRVREATSITAVQSADVVADPSAGGKAVRAVQGGTHTEEESEVPVTKTDVLAAIREATDAELAAVGLARTGTPTTESSAPPERVVESRVTEAGVYHKDTFIARLLVKDKAESAGLTVRAVESSLPDRFTEADVDAKITALKDALALIEREELRPTASAQVVKEATDKRIERLRYMFDGDYQNGYSSFLQAFRDFTGYSGDPFGVSFRRTVMRESFGGGYDSAERTTESMDASTWAQALGDSVTRRMLKAYTLDNLSTWRKIVQIVPVSDFRTQRRIHIGGYGTLPAVLEGGPYQPLTSPGDEEATYAVTKRGGTEDVTFEMVANDDLRQIVRIPTLLGRAAARTLYDFVWGFLINNSTYTADSTALFHSNHANTDTSAALTQTTLSVGRRKMIEQAAYGDSTEILGLTPKYLVVPPELEEIAYQLTKSAVAVPSTPAGPSDTPNIHSAMGLEMILLPAATDANDWYLVGDPNDSPTIEVGFYGGNQEPELFTQSDNSVGSMFNADKMTWKIRHMYGGAIADYRPFYRGQG